MPARIVAEDLGGRKPGPLERFHKDADRSAALAPLQRGVADEH
jgi:hypothetical protein